MKLKRSVRRLLVMAAFAAANHRLNAQADLIAEVFDQLIDDPKVYEQTNKLVQVLLDSANQSAPNYNPYQSVVDAMTKSDNPELFHS